MLLKTAAGNNRFKYVQQCSIEKKEAVEIHFCNKGCAYKLPSLEYRNYIVCAITMAAGSIVYCSPTGKGYMKQFCCWEGKKNTKY